MGRELRLYFAGTSFFSRTPPFFLCCCVVIYWIRNRLFQVSSVRGCGGRVHKVPNPCVPIICCDSLEYLRWHCSRASKGHQNQFARYQIWGPVFWPCQDFSSDSYPRAPFALVALRFLFARAMFCVQLRHAAHILSTT